MMSLPTTTNSVSPANKRHGKPVLMATTTEPAAALVVVQEATPGVPAPTAPVAGTN